MRTDGVIFPYWENAARLTEDYAALGMVLFCLFMITPLCFAAVIGCKYAKKGASAAWKKTEEFSVKFYDAVNDKLYAKEQHAKLLEEHFNENFYDCLNYKELLPDDYFFVPYNRNRNVYNAVLSKIGDPLEYKAAEKTKEYFYQEFLLDGTDNKDNGSV